MLDVVKNQIRDNNPPETKMNYDRLKGLGFSEHETMQYLGACLSTAMFEMLKHKRPFNNERYVKNLNQLPKMPFD